MRAWLNRKHESDSTWEAVAATCDALAYGWHNLYSFPATNLAWGTIGMRHREFGIRLFGLGKFQ